MQVTHGYRKAYALLILTVLVPLFLVGSVYAPTTIVTVATDSDDGSSSLATEGGRKLIQDSFGKMIAIFVDSSGRVGVTYANSEPTLASGWAVPVKSPKGSSSYSHPAAVLVSSTSLRIIVEGGSGSGHINDLPVTLQRDSSSNIIGVSFGSLTRLDSSGSAKYPTAVLSHNGNVLAAWNRASSSDASRIKSLRWKPGTGWISFTGSSSTPDDAVVDSSNRLAIFPAIIERPDNFKVYIVGNRHESSSSKNLVFNKASFDGSNWSWGNQNLSYETNAARGISDSTSMAWDPTRSVVVVAYDISGTTKYGVFRLSSSDSKTHIDTSSLKMTNNEWGSLEVDTSTGVYYIFTMDTSGGDNGKVAYTKNSGGSFSTTLTIIDSGTSNDGISSKILGNSNAIDILYTKTQGSSAQLNFVRISSSSPPPPPPPKKPTAVSISSSPNPSNESQLVTISGSLTDATNGAGLNGRSLNIEQSLDQSNWFLLTQVTTGSGGSYNTIRTFAAGTLYLRTNFPGDSTYAASTSSVNAQVTVPVASGSGYALVVDNSGSVYRYQGGPLTLLGQPTTESLRGAAWRPNGAYALIVGHGAVVMKYDGASLSFINAGASTSVNFQAVAWKPDGSFALIGGSSGTLLRYDGVSVTTVSTGVTTTLRAISWTAGGSSALIVGSSGVMLSFENGAVKPISSGTTSDLYAASWNPNGQYAIAGGTSGTILRYDGTNVASLNTAGLYDPSHIVRGIAWNTAGGLGLIVGDTGLVLSYDGSGLVRLTFNGSPNITSGSLYAVAWSAGSATITGSSGAMFSFNGVLQKLDSGVTTSLRGIGWKPSLS